MFDAIDRAAFHALIRVMMSIFRVTGAAMMRAAELGEMRRLFYRAFDG